MTMHPDNPTRITWRGRQNYIETQETRNCVCCPQRNGHVYGYSQTTLGNDTEIGMNGEHRPRTAAEAVREIIRKHVPDGNTFTITIEVDP